MHALVQYLHVLIPDLQVVIQDLNVLKYFSAKTTDSVSALSESGNVRREVGLC